MRKYFLRRLLQMIPVIVGATLLIYSLVFALPGDPIVAMFGGKTVNRAVVSQIRAEYNLDKPFLVQYLLFLKNALTFHFGNTFSGESVSSVISQAFPVTVKLAVMAFIFEALFGVVFGIISGLNKGRWYDSVILVISLLLISVPTFVTAYLFQYFLGVKWRILPVTAGSDPGFLDLLMPAMVVGTESMAYVIRLTRTQVAYNKRADYVRTAMAKGLSSRQVVLRHIVRNSLIPVITFLGSDLGALMAGALVTEEIFNIHGIGYTLYDGIVRGETTLVVSVVTLLVLIFIVCNLAVDLLYAALDPRIRSAMKGD